MKGVTLKSISITLILGKSGIFRSSYINNIFITSSIDYLIKIVGEDMVEEEIMVEEVAAMVADLEELPNAHHLLAILFNF